METKEGEEAVVDARVCRCCLASNGKWEMCTPYRLAENVFEVCMETIQLCFGIKLKNYQDKSISNFMCSVCVGRLKHVSIFRRQMLNAERTFANYLAAKAAREALLANIVLYHIPSQQGTGNVDSRSDVYVATDRVNPSNEDEDAFATDCHVSKSHPGLLQTKSLIENQLPYNEDNGLKEVNTTPPDEQGLDKDNVDSIDGQNKISEPPADNENDLEMRCDNFNDSETDSAHSFEIIDNQPSSPEDNGPKAVNTTPPDEQELNSINGQTEISEPPADNENDLEMGCDNFNDSETDSAHTSDLIENQLPTPEDEPAPDTIYTWPDIYFTDESDIMTASEVVVETEYNELDDPDSDLAHEVSDNGHPDEPGSHNTDAGSNVLMDAKISENKPNRENTVENNDDHIGKSDSENVSVPNPFQLLLSNNKGTNEDTNGGTYEDANKGTYEDANENAYKDTNENTNAGEDSSPNMTRAYFYEPLSNGLDLCVRVSTSTQCPEIDPTDQDGPDFSCLELGVKSNLIAHSMFNYVRTNISSESETDTCSTRHSSASLTMIDTHDSDINLNIHDIDATVQNLTDSVKMININDNKEIMSNSHTTIQNISGSIKMIIKSVRQDIKRESAQIPKKRGKSMVDKVKKNAALIIKNSFIMPFRYSQSSNGQYLCQYCEEQCYPFIKLREHVFKEHAGISEEQIISSMTQNNFLMLKVEVSNVTCKLCGLLCVRLDKLIEHLVKDHRKTLYCDKKNQPLHGLLGFILDREKPLCPICRQEFEEFIPLAAHMSMFHCDNFTLENSKKYSEIYKSNRIKAAPKKKVDRKLEGVCVMKDIHEMKDVRDLKDVREMRDIHKITDVPESNNVREIRDVHQGKDVFEVKNVYKIRNARKKRDVRLMKDGRKLRDMPRVRDNLEMRDFYHLKSFSRKDVRDMRCVRKMKDFHRMEDTCETKDTCAIKDGHAPKTKDTPKSIDAPTDKYAPKTKGTPKTVDAFQTKRGSEAPKTAHGHEMVDFRKMTPKQKDFSQMRELPYKCKLCDEMFSKYSSKEHHMKIQHGYGWLQCLECSRVFATHTQKILHMALVHEERSRPQNVSKEEWTLAPPSYHCPQMSHNYDLYICDACGTNQYSRQSMEDHLRIHKQENRYKCQICHKKIKSKKSLIMHREIHLRHKTRSTKPSNVLNRFGGAKDVSERNVTPTLIGNRS